MIKTVKDYEKLSEQYNKMLEERNSLIDDLPWYKAKDNRLERENEKLVDENTRLQNELYTMGLNQDEADDKIKGLEDEKERLKEIKQEKRTIRRIFSISIRKRLEYFNKYQELKEKNGELQEVIEGKNSDLLFTEDENKQLKESRDWDYEYIIKVNEENKVLERELKKKNMDADRLGYRWRNSHNEAKTYKTLLSEISQHIGKKPSSSTYKYFRAKLDNLGIGIKEGD